MESLVLDTLVQCPSEHVFTVESVPYIIILNTGVEHHNYYCVLFIIFYYNRL